jgi:uncharacterized membrane protein YeiH
MLFEAIFYIALAAEAMTAALAAGRRSMDWFGVCMIACVTALGGGSSRDILLNHYPLIWVATPWLLLLVCGAALLTIPLARVVAKLRWTFLLLDALGLIVFTIIGCDIAIGLGEPPLIVIVAGMMTGCIGGVLRDVLCNEIPLLFSSELYATISILTGGIYLAGLDYGINRDAMIIAAFLIGFPLRIAAIRFKWGMPKFVFDKGNW